MIGALGTTSPQTSVGALQIGSIGDTGIGALMFDRSCLEGICKTYTSMPLTQKFANGVSLRQQIGQQMNKVYNFPFISSTMTQCPVTMDILSSTCMRSHGADSYMFSLMRDAEFIGRNYLIIGLPRVNCTDILSKATYGNISALGDPHNFYLGAWHQQLPARIIDSITFHSRYTQQPLFTYSAIDIQCYNAVFGSSQFELNALMAGEDALTLHYDPYHVDGAALGKASFKNIDPYGAYTVKPDGSVVMNEEISNDLQIDTTMDNETYREYYRRGVYYESPQFTNSSARHSIHSRRVIHEATKICIPLDILPFGHSMSSALCVSAIHGSIGSITINIRPDWLDQAFYLTRLSDIPSNYALANHTHYTDGSIVGPDDIIKTDDPRKGWVNERSVGRFASREFHEDPTAPQRDQRVSTYAFRELITGGAADVSGTEAGANTAVSRVVEDKNGAVAGYATGAGRFTVTNGVLTTPWGQANQVQKKADLAQDINTYIETISHVSQHAYESLRNNLTLNLYQVSYRTLPCVTQMLTRLPCIYTTTEWLDITVSAQHATQINVANCLYITALFLYFQPIDPNGQRQHKIYPHHLIDHEQPVVNVVHMMNECGQADGKFDWFMLNKMIPSIAEATHPIPDNMGLITFAPKLSADSFPCAFYDTNTHGQLLLNFEPFTGNNAMAPGTTINLRNGLITVACMGCNALAVANLNMYKLSA